MNDLFSTLDLDSWKPVVTALALPPVPLLLLALIGARLILPRRGLGWLLVLLSVALLWLSSCAGAAYALQQVLLPPPAALSFDRVRELRNEVAAGKGGTAIVVLGGGAEPFAPEYGVSNLTNVSLERLRYGLWLGRETGAPVGFSGGIGTAAATEGTPEAKVAARVATEEFGRPLRFVEAESRDTRENATRMLALLKPANVGHVVLVTHGYHMPRALRAFEEAAAGGNVRIEPAPMGLARRIERPVLEWLPSSRGFAQVRQVLREVYGKLAGA